MSEVNIYKLIEEFINKSNNNNNINNNDLKLLTPPQSPPLIDENNKKVEINDKQQIYFNNNNNDDDVDDDDDENDNYNKILIEELNNQTIPSNNNNNNNNNGLYTLKPNRPYSYYVATNFHPVDNTPIIQTIINQTLKDNHNVKTNNNNDDDDDIKKKSLNKSKNKNKNRLSASLTDIKKSNSHNNDKLNTINSKALNNDENILKQFSSQDFVFKGNNNKLKQFEIVNQKAKMNRINRLFRRLFTFNRKIKSSSPLSSSMTTPITMLDDQHDKQIHHHINYTHNNDIENDNDTSKFVRFFTSFRSSSVHNRKNNNNTTPIVGKKLEIENENEKTVEYDQDKTIYNLNASNNLPHISLVIKANTSLESTKTNETFYIEIVDKLKRIVDDCLNENEQTNLNINKNNNEIEIPFIDDEEELNEDEELTFGSQTNTFTTITDLSFNGNKFLSSTNNNNFKIDLPKNLIKKLIDDVSVSKLDEIINQITLNNNIDWYQIAILFELISRAVKYVGFNSNLSIKLKEVAVDYINKKYNDWIKSQNGGWSSIPDLKYTPFSELLEI